VRLVSFPSWELFAAQPADYQEAVLPASITARVAVEAGVSHGWERWVGSQGAVIGLNRFGASAPFAILYDKFGITIDSIVNAANHALGMDSANQDSSY
jgi:transketolase